MQSRSVEIADSLRNRLTPKEQETRKRIPLLTGGIDTDVSPSELRDDQSPLVENMLVLRGRLVSDTGYVPFGSGDIVGTPQATFQVNHANGNKDTILVTTKTAYFLDTKGVWQSDGTLALAGRIDEPVSFVSYAPSDWIVMTNGVDPPFYFSLGHFAFVPFDVPGIVCRSLSVFHSSLLLNGTTEADGPHPRRVRASDIGVPTALKTIIEGAATGVAAIYDLLDTDDDIHCAFPLGSWLILYRHSSIMRGTYLGSSPNLLIFWEYMIVGDGAQSVGGVCPISVPQGGAYHIVVGNHSVYRYRGDYSVERLADPVFQTEFGATSDLNEMAKATIWTQYIAQYNEVWIGLPTNESEVPDTVLRLDLSLQQPTWFKRRFYDKFLSAGVLLTRFEEDQSVPLVILTGPTGVYQYDFVSPLDNGWPVHWRFETKDIGEGNVVNRYQRLLVRGTGSFDIGVELSLDRGGSWRFIDTINFAHAEVALLTFDAVGEYCRVRLSGDDPSFKVTWLELWYIFEAEWVPLRSGHVSAALGA